LAQIFMYVQPSPAGLLYPLIIADKTVIESGDTGEIYLTRKGGALSLVIGVPAKDIEGITDEKELVSLFAHYALHIAMSHPVRVKIHAGEGMNETALHLAADLLVHHVIKTMASRAHVTMHRSFERLNRIYRDTDISNDDTLLDVYKKIKDKVPDNYVPNEAFDDTVDEEEVSPGTAETFYKKMAGPVASYIEKQYGSVGGNEMETIEPKPREFPAAKQIRAWVARSVSVGAIHSRRKVSKRYGSVKKPQYGANRYFRPRKHILVAVDVSGSMMSKELENVFGCLKHPAITYDILQFDTKIRAVLTQKKISYNEVKLYGRGGTAFEDVQKHVNENAKKYAGVIVFTDGWGSADEQEPKLPWLWIITKQSGDPPVQWGSVIKLNYED